MKSESTSELATALAKAQGAMNNAKINKVNPHFKNKYADLASVRDAIIPVLTKHDLSIVQTMVVAENVFILHSVLLHKSGEWISSDYPLPMGAKPQELGSALTYARRYSLAALVCISADEDDDAEVARQTDQKNSAKAATKQTASAIAPQPYEPVAGGPQLIKVPMLDDTNMKPDWITWGGIYVASLTTSKTKADAELWNTLNAAPLNTLATDMPKVYQRIVDRALAHYDGLKE